MRKLSRDFVPGDLIACRMLNYGMIKLISNRADYLLMDWVPTQCTVLSHPKEIFDDTSDSVFKRMLVLETVEHGEVRVWNDETNFFSVLNRC